MTKLGWIVLGMGLFGWLAWFAAMDAVRRDVSFDRWLKERLTFDKGVGHE